MSTRIYWLHALSPTHVGTGRGVGYIDLPIDRDGVTGWPIVRGSSFKGVWADYFGATPENRQLDQALGTAFGVASDEESASKAGALIPTDAKLVCIPVRSFRGTFAWCTSPLCLRMLRRLLELAGVQGLPEPPRGLSDNEALHTTDGVVAEGDRIYLEDLDFSAEDHRSADEWSSRLGRWVFPDDEGWSSAFRQRFVVVSDTAFDFFCRTGTEVYTRVRIDDDTKTVAKGALWTEEALPAETILAGMIKCDRLFGRNGKEMTAEGLLDKYASGEILLQLGGKATVGRGLFDAYSPPWRIGKDER